MAKKKTQRSLKPLRSLHKNRYKWGKTVSKILIGQDMGNWLEKIKENDWKKVAG
jgi:hypothetical protein